MESSRFDRDIEQNGASMSQDQKSNGRKRKVLVVGAGAAG